MEPENLRGLSRQVKTYRGRTAAAVSDLFRADLLKYRGRPMPARPLWQVHLYQFAVVLSGDEERARKVVMETLDASVARRAAHIDAERIVTGQFQVVRRRLLKEVPQNGRAQSRADAVTLPPEALECLGSTDRGTLLARLHALAEPGRTALTLLALDAMEGDEVARLLDLRREELGDIAHEARTSLYQSLRS